jgi:hypothetical protein
LVCGDSLDQRSHGPAAEAAGLGQNLASRGRNLARRDIVTRIGLSAFGFSGR